MPPPLDRISIELTNRCQKRCSFCYNHSHPAGESHWTAEDLIELLHDCRAQGVCAVSLGGGEPLESPLLWDVLAAVRGTMFRSLTTNGLLLDRLKEKLIAAAPEKVHISLHFPESRAEVDRVIRQTTQLADAGVRSGINLLVARSQLREARQAAQRIRAAGIDNQRILYLPMRGSETPSPREVAAVADGPFQSMSCLGGCARSERFCSLRWDRTVAWCSYTSSRRPLVELSHRGLLAALEDLPLVFCGPTMQGEP